MRSLACGIVFAVSLGGFSMPAPADNPTTPAPTTPPATPVNPHAAEIARLAYDQALSEARTAAFTAQSAELTARYGTTPPLPTGVITGAENLGGLTGSLLAVAMRDASKQVAAAYPGDKTTSLLITSTTDRRSQVVAAASLTTQLDELSDNAEALRDDLTGAAAGAATLQAAELLAPLGALENILNIFRSDYTVHTTPIQTDALALQLTVAAAVQTKYKDVRVDGLAVSNSLPLLMKLARFQTLVSELEHLSLPEGDANQADIDAFVTRAKAFLTAGETKGSDGQTPFEKAAAAQQWATAGDTILYVQSVSTNAVLISAKSWFSWRNTVHAVLSGVLKYAYVDSTNKVLASGLVRMGGKTAINLKQLAKSDTEWAGTDVSERQVIQ